MTRRRRSTFCMVTEPLTSPPSSPHRSRRHRDSGRHRVDADDGTFSHRSMLTDTSTFSSSDGKRAYKKTTVTTTTTETVEPPSASSSSSSHSSSNWSCGWDAPLISEPTLSSLPTYTFDSEHDKRAKNAKKRSDKKKGEALASRRQSRKQQHQHRRRPTDAETDAETYRANRASDPWLGRRDGGSFEGKDDARARARSSRLTDDGPWSRGLASESDAIVACHSSDDHAVANTSSWPHATATATATATHAAADGTSNTGESADKSSGDEESTSASSFASADSAATASTTATDVDRRDREETADRTNSNDDSVYYNAHAESAASALKGPVETDDEDDDGDANSNIEDRADDRSGDGAQTCPESAADYDSVDRDYSAGHCSVHCHCAHGADRDDSQQTASTAHADEQDDSVTDASWDNSAARCTCHCAPTSTDSTDASTARSSSLSLTDCARVEINGGAQKSREPPVYIRACHGHHYSGDRHGSPYDDNSHGDDLYESDDVRPSREDGVVETASVTVAEPAVRPCEPDAPHPIYGRPRFAHHAAKPSAPVVVGPGVCDIPGGAPESFCALGATYTLLAGAVDTRCRIEAALVTLQPRACAQPCLVFAGSDVSFVGVSGTGSITINGRTYPLAASAYFYVRAGSAFAVANIASVTPLVFVQQFSGAAAGLGFYREVATYEASVGGAANVDPRVIEAIASHYHVRTERTLCGTNVGARQSTFVPPGVVRFVPTPLCEADDDDASKDSASSSLSSSSCLYASTTAGHDDGQSSDNDSSTGDWSSADASALGAVSIDAKDAGVDSWGLRRRQLLVLAAVDACRGPNAKPAATVRPTDLDAFVAVGPLGSRVTVRATIIRDPRFGGCPDVLARPTINGAQVITLATGVSYWTYYDEAEDNIIVQSLPGSRLPAILPHPFGAPVALASCVPVPGITAALPPVTGLPPISVRPLPFA